MMQEKSLKLFKNKAKKDYFYHRKINSQILIEVHY